MPLTSRIVYPPAAEFPDIRTVGSVQVVATLTEIKRLDKIEFLGFLLAFLVPGESATPRVQQQSDTFSQAASHVGAASVLEELIDHGGVGQR